MIYGGANIRPSFSLGTNPLENIMKAFTNIALILFTTLILGCGGNSDLPEIGIVKGQLTLDGQPVKQANIMFYPLSKGRSSTAITDDEGKYILSYKADVPGAMVGEHEVIVSTKNDPVGEPGPGYVPGRKEEFPAKYNTETELRKTVEFGKNVINFHLKSK